jgi:hypothetical protein
MKTAIEVVEHTEEIITNIYLRPAMFVIKHWAMVTERLAIPLPSGFPDTRHSFSPDTLAPNY